MGLTNSFTKFAAIASTALLFGTAANAAVVVQGEIQTIPGTTSNNGGEATEVDYWGFSVNSTGAVTIDVLSWLWDRDSDGTGHFIDSSIHLFTDDGSLDAGDIVASNDDDHINGFSDGTTSIGADSYLGLNLAAGDYLLAIGDFSLSIASAVAGINFDGYGPSMYDGTGLIKHNSDGSCIRIFDCSYGDYQITFSDSVSSVSAVSAVPLPAALPMLAAGLGLFGFAGRRRKNKAVS